MKRTGQLLNRIFLSILLLNIVIAFASNINTTVDCFVVNRYIGDTAAAVMAIYFPLKLLTLVPMFLISGGTNVVCSKLLGEKKWEDVDRIYISSAVFMVAIQLILSCLMYFAPNTLASFFCFGRTEMGLQSYVAEYFKGIAFFAPCMGMYTIIMSILQLKGDTLVSYIAIVLMLIVNTIGDLLSVTVLEPSLFSIGFVSFFSAFLALIVLFARLILYKKLDFSQIKNVASHFCEDMSEIVKKGLPNCCLLFLATVCGIVVNKCILTYADVIAMSGYSIFNSIREVFVPIASGLGTTTMVAVSFLKGEKDYEGVSFFRRFFLKYAIFILGTAGLLMYIFAPAIIHLFTGGETGRVAIIFMRCFALGMPFFGFRFFVNSYTLAMNLFYETYTTTFLSEFGLQVVYIIALGKAWGIRGIAIGILLAEISLLVVSMIYAGLMRWLNAKKWKQIIFEDEVKQEIEYVDGTSLAEEKKAAGFLYEVTVSNMDQIMACVDTFDKLRKKYDLDFRISNYIELAIEELGTHTLNEEKNRLIDLHIAFRKDTLILSLRDTGHINNPSQWQNRIDNCNEYEAISYRVLNRLADFIIYTTSFNYNCFTMHFKVSSGNLS